MLRVPLGMKIKYNLSLLFKLYSCQSNLSWCSKPKQVSTTRGAWVGLVLLPSLWAQPGCECHQHLPQSIMKRGISQTLIPLGWS